MKLLKKEGDKPGVTVECTLKDKTEKNNNETNVSEIVLPFYENKIFHLLSTPEGCCQRV